MKVLHVLRQLNPGGIECWLERLIRLWPQQSRPEFHLALEESDFGILAPEFVSQGVKLHYCPPPRKFGDSARSFLSILKRSGPFAAVHCHNHHASAFHLLLAAKSGVPLRISHSHADLRNGLAQQFVLRHWYRKSASLALQSLANIKLAVSGGAAKDLFGEHARGLSVFPCGTDFESLFAAECRPDPSRFTLVHVGRLVPGKNHQLLLKIMAALIQRQSNARLWLVGDGPLRSSLELEATRLGIGECVHFWGNRSDVPALLGAANLFIFPSLAEGLGLAAIEAQAAGLPVLLARHLPKDLNLLPGRCRRLALDLPIHKWVDSILEMSAIPAMSLTERRSALGQSRFSIHSNIRILSRIYAG